MSLLLVVMPFVTSSDASIYMVPNCPVDIHGLLGFMFPRLDIKTRWNPRTALENERPSTCGPPNAPGTCVLRIREKATSPRETEQPRFDK